MNQEAMGEQPDPDALLARVSEDDKRARRGRLTIFFGAAPGVGKTYAMLESARFEREEGVMSSSDWSRRTDATTRERSCSASKFFHDARSSIAASRSTSSTSTHA